MQLSALEETAWLTLYCQSVSGSRFGLNKTFADWFLGEVGRPSFAGTLAWRTLTGVALRASLIDAWVEDHLSRAREEGTQLDYWSMGCGFDYRWEKFSSYFDGTIAEYVEFDQSALMREKKEMLARSPYAEKYLRVSQRPGDLIADLPDSLPASDRPVLVVLEGVIDYLDREQKLALLGAIRARAPRCTVIVDAQNAWSIGMQNKKREIATGSKAVGFSWAPRDVRAFYEREAGWRIARTRSIMRETFGSRSVLLKYLPVPRTIAECAMLLELHAMQ